ncbi:MAG: recombination protein RecR, recombination protein RecR [Candidatus Peregrinibacteria bacterium GW2011_GWE2_39_6]|nr:MAG: recombination protein RecR, recombination protein RecR [Candidatus Peregrinibacteria bacterium GW2011_GWF2_39_17]KKR26271.1 MAG: recombination protein RecR, recombination protein RecR [Candidatus Peregrinibacteria bacterium GW2011_GWE2_39_6]HCW32411.1 recombination protein RecR [Candidatus Peregrinibacteria bacterium]
MLNSIPKSVQDLIQAFAKLPGIGPKTASRLAMYLIQAPENIGNDLAQSILSLKSATTLCKECWHLATESPCAICSNLYREEGIICVVEEPADLIALEKTGTYKGLYHVLHGVLSPIDGIGPDDLKIKELIERLKISLASEKPVWEIILATNPTMEGESTANYLSKLIHPLGIKVTRLARGLPSGGDIEYADDLTLTRALEGRQNF